MLASAARTLEFNGSDREAVRRALAVIELLAGITNDRPLPMDSLCAWLWGLAGVARPYTPMLSSEGRRFVRRFTEAPERAPLLSPALRAECR